MTKRGRAPLVVVYALAALLVGAIVAAVLVVGPASGASSARTRIVTAQRGVVQSTASGSGNVQASSELDLGFKTAGTVTQIYVRQGQQVGQGQLVATLDPHSAEVTLEQAKANLQSAEAALAREEETDGESSSSSGSSPSSSGDSPSATGAARAETAATKPASTKPAPKKSASKKSAKKKPAQANDGSKKSEEPAESSSSSSSSSSSEISAATREANIASARANVKSDRLTVENDERSVADTRLTAPESGTIVSLGGEVGETVSGGGTSRAASETSESSSGSGGGGSNPSNDSSSNSSESNASGGAFAVLSDLSEMKLVVPLSESEVGSVKRGQTATVTVEALKGAKLAAHVSEVAALPTSNSGVVSYDVTFALDQLTAGLKPGMSATAEVVVQQAEGVNVPSSAISGGSVTVIEGGKQVQRPVTTGLAGDSTTIVLSGLKAGERVALPLASSGGGANLLSRLGSRSGGSGSIRSGLGGGFSGGFAGGAGGAGGGPRISGGPGPGG
ncbi:MAG TPA: HlyD family efflux transporter periplasmic adaptor subunit [Solirubrobacteraceae bacterium]|nr:HlyD family efflux transporter periplasmic adaptor subunit [Solirubrobacteraceae bacterium]